MIKIVIFCLIVYTISFAIVYKKPLIAKPYEWLMRIFWLKGSLDCMICTPFWIAGIVSALNIFILPEMDITPSLVIFGMPEAWLEYTASILMDMFSVASVVFIVDQFLLFVTENRKLDVTICKEKDNSETQLLHD